VVGYGFCFFGAIGKGHRKKKKNRREKKVSGDKAGHLLLSLYSIFTALLYSSPASSHIYNSSNTSQFLSLAPTSKNHTKNG